jgi:hypothetical protein
MAAIDDLIKQIQGQGTTDKWSGGYGADAATKDMARILSSIGITDINQFGKITAPFEEYVGTEYEGGPAVYETRMRETFGNKETGQPVPDTYTERQTGNAWGGTYEGKGNTGYRVEFTPDGKPIFYTTGASSSNVVEKIKPFAQMALLAAGIGGLEALGLGAGGAGAAGGAAAGGATGAGLTAGAAELGSLTSGLGAGTGLSAGASGLGLNAAGAGLGSLGTGAGITAGSGLVGTGVLTGSSLGAGLLGTGAGLAGLTGTGVLSASNLGQALLGTTSTTPLVGTGVLSGSELGAKLLGTGANTAATVGGLTGLTNAANVGYGALNTGVSTGLTGLGSGALNTGINPSGASTMASPIDTPITPTTPAKGLGPSDALRAAGLIATIAGVGNAVGGGGGGTSGFPIVPIPSDWTSPIKPTGTAAFTPLAPIDFGNKEMLRGTQWEQLLSPDYGKAPAMPTPTNPSNMTFNELTKILGGSTTSAPSQNLSINDVIAGIQSQYGQTPQVPMG